MSSSNVTFVMNVFHISEVMINLQNHFHVIHVEKNSRKDNMLQHIKLHEPKPHQCSHCKEFFSREFNLQRHIENNHKVSFPNGGTFVSEDKVKAQS